MRYHIIDKDERNAREELKKYTFEELLNFFEPSEELKRDCPELCYKWADIRDLHDLREYLEMETDGMRQHYVIEEVKKQLNNISFV